MAIGYPIPKEEAHARAAGTSLPISHKDSKVVCRHINGMNVEGAKRFLQELTEERRDIDGKHYTKAAGHILEVVEGAEKNAEHEGLEDLTIKTITAEKGPNRQRAKRGRDMGGKRLKLTHIKVVLEGEKVVEEIEEEQPGEPETEEEGEETEATDEEAVDETEYEAEEEISESQETTGKEETDTSVLDGTVPEVKDAVDETDDLQALMEAEKEGKDRKTVKDYLEKLQGGDDE